MTDNTITLYNSDREPYYKLSLNKITGKYSIYFTMSISDDVLIYLSIYEVVTLQNYLYQIYNSDVLLEPIKIILPPSNKYLQAFIILEPCGIYGHLAWYEGINIAISIDDKILNGFIGIEDVQDLYDILQNLIIRRATE